MLKKLMLWVCFMILAGSLEKDTWAMYLMVYSVNGAAGFATAAIQMTLIYLISGLFDRIYSY